MIDYPRFQYHPLQRPAKGGALPAAKSEAPITSFAGFLRHSDPVYEDRYKGLRDNLGREYLANQNLSPGLKTTYPHRIGVIFGYITDFFVGYMLEAKLQRFDDVPKDSAIIDKMQNFLILHKLAKDSHPSILKHFRRFCREVLEIDMPDNPRQRRKKHPEGAPQKP